MNAFASALGGALAAITLLMAALLVVPPSQKAPATSQDGPGATIAPDRAADAPAAASAPGRARTEGAAYLLQGDVGTNVRAALNANGGALQSFEIAPGATWSFGHSIAPISAMGYLPVVCGPAGCNAGGGWCDLAAEYVKVADRLGLQSSFPAHAGVSDSRFPGILLDEQGNGGDLTIYNNQTAPIWFRASEQGGQLVIEGGF